MAGVDDVEATVSLIDRFLGSKDTRSLRAVFLFAVLAGAVWIAYVCDRFDPWAPGPWPRKAEVSALGSKLDDHGRKIDSILTLTLAQEIRIAADAVCMETKPSARFSELAHIEELQQQYYQVTRQRYPVSSCN